MTHAGAVSSPAGSAFSTAIDAALDGTPLRAYQLRVAMLCAIVAMLDGFDTQAIAFVAPVLGELWHVGPGRFGLIFAAGLVGIMVGQLTLGRLADSIGRRPVILFCTALFAAGSLVTAKADGWIMLLTLRFVTGIGLGGATPNVIALTAEFSPPRIRATMITAMFAGFPLGAAAGGYFSSHLIPPTAGSRSSSSAASYRSRCSPSSFRHCPNRHTTSGCAAAAIRGSRASLHGSFPLACPRHCRAGRPPPRCRHSPRPRPRIARRPLTPRRRTSRPRPGSASSARTARR